MDLTSYLLGRKSSGGGGGGSDLDWSAIGYSETPQAIQDGYNYAVEIMRNWDSSSTMTNKFKNDMELMFMPVVDISKDSYLSNMFQYCNNLLQVENLDYSKAIYLDNMYDGCINLKSISNFNATGRMQYTFQNCSRLETLQGNIKTENLRSAFSGCTNLQNIPIIDGSMISGSNALQNTFLNCASLTDTSLDNILQLCISATSYGGTKTLSKLGLNSTNYPTSRIEALPHYQGFINAGWTIGY